MYKGKTEVLILHDSDMKTDIAAYIMNWCSDFKVNCSIQNSYEYFETDEFVIQIKTPDYLLNAVRTPEYFIDICRNRHMAYHQDLVENQVFPDENTMNISMLDELLYSLQFV